MSKWMKRSGVAAGSAVLGAAATAGQAEAAWTVDVAGLTTDVTTIGASLLAVAVVIYGFRVVRRMIGH